MAYAVSRDKLSIGSRIGDWTVLEIPSTCKSKVICKCTCGRVKLVDVDNLLRNGSTRCKSCAIGSRGAKYGRPVRGAERNRLYFVWAGIKARCEPRAGNQGSSYQKLGIMMCDEWKCDFAAFRDWSLANGYREGLSIDRWPNPYGDYEPSNCRWATQRQQQRNRTNNRLIAAFGETKPLIEWAEDRRCTVGRSGLSSRLNKGWNPEDAIMTPIDIAEETRAAETRGNQNGNSTLDEQAVRSIRQQCIEGHKPQWQIAKEFGIAQCTVSAIHRRKLWGWLP